MRLLKTILFTALTGFTPALSAQVIDNIASYRETGNDKYIRFYYDNDFFTATDYYYTQGMCLELVNANLEKFPLSHLLIRPSKFSNRFGVAVEHIGYTPTSIRHTEIINGDRPFAACLFLKTFAIAVNAEKKQRITSAFSMGVIGPAAGGEEMQTSIHRWLKNIEPLGWSNQIANDIILNYELGYEKTLLDHQTLRLNWSSDLKAGTLNDKISSSFTIMAGFLPALSDTRASEKKKFRLHLYNQSNISLIGYDASLQGGVFNHKSPYTINKNDMTRFTFQNNIGVVIKLYSIHLEYYQAIITEEFATGKYHRWGGVRVGWEF
ncbi:MAG: lipid A deacylase LpxR family protein [Bacteroidia bacterium]